MARRAQTKEREVKKKSNIGRRIFLCMLVLIAIAGGLFARRVYDLEGNWLAALMGHDKNTLQRLDRLTFLVLGESDGMSDTIMVWSYDPKIQEACMLSIPRDTFVGDNPNRAGADDKLNAKYLSGQDPANALKYVNEITGLDIKYYLVIDTEAVKELVDIIDGIEFDVPIDMKYDDNSQDLHINLKAGYQHLNGDQVEQLTRFRHNNNGSTYPWEYGIEDFGRMKTQRAVLKTIASKLISWKNVNRIWDIMDVLDKYVKTNMDIKSTKDYVPYAININLDDVRAEQIPAEPKTLNGGSFVVYDKEKTKELIDEMFRLNQEADNEDNITE